jgi:hypothetical protein
VGSKPYLGASPSPSPVQGHRKTPPIMTISFAAHLVTCRTTLALRAVLKPCKLSTGSQLWSYLNALGESTKTLLFLKNYFSTLYTELLNSTICHETRRAHDRWPSLRIQVLWGERTWFCHIPSGWLRSLVSSSVKWGYTNTCLSKWWWVSNELLW